MNTVPFGRTGLKVSPLTLGCIMFGGKTTPEDSARIIDRALELKLSAAELARIDEIVPPGSHTSPYYEAPFGPHLHRW